MCREDLCKERRPAAAGAEYEEIARVCHRYLSSTVWLKSCA